MTLKHPSETVVLITGASKGIGFATAECLAKEGYQVIATARAPDNSPDLLKLAAQYPNLQIKQLDVTDTEENIGRTISESGPIDVLINNAGIGLVGVAESFSCEQISQVFSTNVLGVVKVTNAVLPGMRARNSGYIITLSSIVGPLPDMRQCFYSGSKAMIEHYTSQLKNDLEEDDFNIKVANVHPGPVVTHFERATPEGNRFARRFHPYPKGKTNTAKWRKLMKDGRPVEESVATILSVLRDENPAFWNPTEGRVAQNFNDVYRDPKGTRFSKGPIFSPRSDVREPIPVKRTFVGQMARTSDHQSHAVVAPDDHEDHVARRRKKQRT